MENLIERFTLECRTNKSGKLVNSNMSIKDNKGKITDATVWARLRVEAISQIDSSKKKYKNFLIYMKKKQ